MLAFLESYHCCCYSTNRNQVLYYSFRWYYYYWHSFPWTPSYLMLSLTLNWMISPAFEAAVGAAAAAVCVAAAAVVDRDSSTLRLDYYWYYCYRLWNFAKSPDLRQMFRQRRNRRLVLLAAKSRHSPCPQGGRHRCPWWWRWWLSSRCNRNRLFSKAIIL